MDNRHTKKKKKGMSTKMEEEKFVLMNLWYIKRVAGGENQLHFFRVWTHVVCVLCSFHGLSSPSLSIFVIQFRCLDPTWGMVSIAPTVMNVISQDALSWWLGCRSFFFYIYFSLLSFIVISLLPSVMMRAWIWKTICMGHQFILRATTSSD